MCVGNRRRRTPGRASRLFVRWTWAIPFTRRVKQAALLSSLPFVMHRRPACPPEQFVVMGSSAESCGRARFEFPLGDGFGPGGQSQWQPARSRKEATHDITGPHDVRLARRLGVDRTTRRKHRLERSRTLRERRRMARRDREQRERAPHRRRHLHQMGDVLAQRLRAVRPAH
jgi:hypothetical protein